MNGENINEETKKKKKQVNIDELGMDDEEIHEVEKRRVTIAVNAIQEEEEVEKIILNPDDFSLQILAKLKNEFLSRYSKIKYLLVFDKSIAQSDVGYFMLNPLDNCSLLNKGFKLNLSPLRDLIYYRVVNINNKLYFIGGICTKARKVLPQTLEYDIKTNTWRECDNLNIARCKFSVSVTNNKIYVLGGQDIYGTPLDSIERYDLEDDEWIEIGILARPTKFHASCVLKNRYIVTSGGYRARDNNFNIYDTEAQDWRNGLLTFDLPLERENHSMIIHNGSVYIIGGIRYEARVNDPENPEPINENSINSLNINSFITLSNKVWKTLSHPRTYQDRNGCSLCQLGKYIYIIGGHTIENNENPNAVESKLIERFDPVTNQIEKVFMIEPDIPSMDVDTCIVDVDIILNQNFTIDAIFFENCPLW